MQPDHTATAPTCLALATPLAADAAIAARPTGAPRWAAYGRRLPAALVVLALAGSLLLRFVDLDRTITADEGYWMDRTLHFGAALADGDLRGTFLTGHPGVTVMWLGVLGIGPERLSTLAALRPGPFEAIEQAPEYLPAFSAARGAVAVTTALLFTLAAVLFWRLVGPAPAVAGSALLLLDPYAIGMTRLLHPDALLAPLMLVSALAGLVYWLRGRQHRYLVLSAVAGGLALLSKAPAAHGVLFFGLLGVLAGWRAGQRRRAMAALLLWGVIAVAVYAALWPALWVDPMGRIEALTTFVRSTAGVAHGSDTFFQGQIVPGDPGPAFYPVALALRLGALCTVGILGLILARRRDLDLGVTLRLAAYTALFIVLLTITPKKQDRYLLPTLLAVDLLGGVGLWALVRRLRADRLAAVVLAAVVVGQGAAFAATRPYPIAAYNPLLGGADTARRTMVVGWGEGLDRVAAFLSSQPGADRAVVATNYNHAIRPRIGGAAVSLVRAPAKVVPAIRYVVVYVSTAQRGGLPQYAYRAATARPPVFVATVNGQPYAWVFENPLYDAATHPGHSVEETPDDEEDE
ncbi:MAG: hypothetical protein IT305_13160 [Chloroflexi bacterium]|nr:hypothetical protein [Chloroflexota bacterium]